MAKETVESLCDKAQQALARGLNQEARLYFQQALGLRAEDADAHYGLATVLFLLNELSSSAFHFKEVTRLDPTRAGAFINLGAVYNRLEQLDEALAVLRRGIQLDKTRAEGYYNLGLVYKRKGQLDLAIQSYREATRVNPRMADAHFNVANIYVEKEQYRLAILHYTHALEVRPNWEKAERALEVAKQAQQDAADASHAHEKPETIEMSAPQRPDPARKHLDPERLVDPEHHSSALQQLHHATVDTDKVGRNFLKVLEEEVEKSIKTLSNCILYPDSSSGDMDRCIKQVETAMADMRSLQEKLRKSIEVVHRYGEHLINT